MPLNIGALQVIIRSHRKLRKEEITSGPKGRAAHQSQRVCDSVVNMASMIRFNIPQIPPTRNFLEVSRFLHLVVRPWLYIAHAPIACHKPSPLLVTYVSF